MFKGLANALLDRKIRRMGRLTSMCILVGLVAGFGAAAFFIMLESGSAFFLGYLANYHPAPPGNEQPPAFLEVLHVARNGGIIRWMLLILPALGGLISGILVFSLAPEAEGHGTDAAIESYHFKDGAVRPRVPFVKAITSMITIGTGGSGGREGPIAQIGSGFGSMLGRWLQVSPHERRILMASGMSAGIGAIFHAPLAGALFGAEVLYRDPDFEHEVLVPGFVSSIVAYSVFGGIFGFHSLFVTPDELRFLQVSELVPYLILALVSSLGAYLYIKAFYGFRGVLFGGRLRVLPNHVKPAIGGLLVGVIGFFLPEALGAGYGVVQMCFDDNVLQLPSAEAFAGILPAVMQNEILVAAFLLLVIALAKIATTAFSIGSGGSGGVFGPAVTIGGALGGATGMLLMYFMGSGIEPGAFTLVGMAGFFAGAANTPVSTIIMVSEMTGNYNLLLPSMMVCVISYALCRRFTLYEKQLPSRLDAPSKLGNMASAILRNMTVRQALNYRPLDELITVRRDSGLGELVELFSHCNQACFPVVDGDGRLTGMVDASDIRRIVTEPGMEELIIARDIERPPVTVTPEDSLLAALNNMVKTDSVEIVVVNNSPTNPKIEGTLSRGDIVAAYNRQIVATP
jgi:CIC family chloride channel protein